MIDKEKGFFKTFEGMHSPPPHFMLHTSESATEKCSECYHIIIIL